MLTSTDPNGITTTYAYTPLNLRAAVSYSGSSAHSVSYSYDADSSKTGMTDATGSSSYSYDPFGELTSTTNGAGQITGYGYTPDGQVSSITYPLPSGATWATSGTVSYGFDNADRLTSAIDFSGNKITINDTADGLSYSDLLGSTGDTIATGYDNTDSPSSIALKNSSSTLGSVSYANAPSGDILTETDSPSVPTSPATYSYDAQGRVSSMTPGTGSQLGYSFDASGNLVSDAGASATYDHASELTSATLSGTNYNFTYSADGEELNVTAAGTTVAAGTWNGAQELTAYSDSPGDLTAATYDGDGLRASSTSNPSGGTATTQQYVWDTVGQTPLLLMDSGNAYIYDGSGTPAEQVNLSTGTITYLIADSLGSVRGTVNSSGALTGTTSYDAMGNPLTAGGLSSATPFGFAGGYTDPTGLIYLINRYYDPVLGQFISPDPAAEQTQEPYEYAAGNPVSTKDPTGSMPIPIGPAAGIDPGQYPVDGAPCHDNRTWCNLILVGSVVEFMNGYPVSVPQLEEFKIQVDPGAVTSKIRVKFRGNLKVPDIIVSLQLQATIMCAGGLTTICGQKIYWIVDLRDPFTFTVRTFRGVNMGGSKMGIAFDLTSDCPECTIKAGDGRARTGTAKCRRGGRICEY